MSDGFMVRAHVVPADHGQRLSVTVVRGGKQLGTSHALPWRTQAIDQEAQFNTIWEIMGAAIKRELGLAS